MENLWIKTKSFGIKCKRVWHSLKKPSKEEYKHVAKISALGILVLGAIGFAVSLIMQIFV